MKFPITDAVSTNAKGKLRDMEIEDNFDEALTTLAKTFATGVVFMLDGTGPWEIHDKRAWPLRRRSDAGERYHLLSQSFKWPSGQGVSLIRPSIPDYDDELAHQIDWEAKAEVECPACGDFFDVEPDADYPCECGEGQLVSPLVLWGVL